MIIFVLNLIIEPRPNQPGSQLQQDSLSLHGHRKYDIIQEFLKPKITILKFWTKEQWKCMKGNLNKGDFPSGWSPCLVQKNGANDILASKLAERLLAILQLCKKGLGRGGGIVVCVLAFYSNDLSSNPAGY